MRRRRHPRSPAPTRTGVCEMKAAQRLAEWTGSLAYEEIPANVVETAKLHLLDTIGCGLSGGTTAAARLAGMSADATASALGIAGSFAGGLFAYLDDATPTKPLHPAWAAHGGLLATRLASLGAEGPRGVFENRFGIYYAFVGATHGE